MSNRKTEPETDPDIPPLTAAERASLLETAGEDYFTLSMGYFEPERHNEHDEEGQRHWLTRRLFFQPDVRPEGRYPPRALRKAGQDAQALWVALAAYVATDPDTWVFPEQRLSPAQVARLTCTLRQAAQKIHGLRYRNVEDRRQMYVPLPIESFLTWDAETGTVEPPSIGANETQVPFALRLMIRDDMVPDLDAAITAVRRVFAGPAGAEIIRQLRESPELEHVLTDDEDSVWLVTPIVMPPRTRPSTEKHRIPSYRRVKQAVFAGFRRTGFDIQWYAGRCYVTVPSYHTEGGAGRFICFENPKGGVAGTGLSFQEI